MKPVFISLMTLSFLLLSSVVHASEWPGKTLSPYFYIPNGDPKVDQLPLKETSAKVNIAGVIATVQVSQVYVNEGAAPIEAVYVFPGSIHAAVTGMEMQVGDRTIKAKIMTRQDASETYTKARKAGKTASLLEQDRPNVFKMKIANIMPQQRVVVRLNYVEALVPQDGIYEFVYPTVVGPRFTEASATDSKQSWIRNPHTKAGASPSYGWDLEAKIQAGNAIRSLMSPSHTLATRFLGKKEVTIDLDDKTGGNRDFVLRYRLSGDAIEAGILLFPGAQEKFFLATVQPPKRVTPNLLPAREYIFIVDVSGSMSGFPMQATKKLMRTLLGGLKGKDRFNLMLFAGGNSVLSPKSLPASKQNLAKAITAIDRMKGGGSTQILSALKQGLALKRSDAATTFVIITDGYVTVERKAFDLIRKNLNEANLFAFGVGSSVNRHLVEGMARAGMGEAFIALNEKEAKKQARAFADYISSPVLTNVSLRFEGLDAYDVVPQKIPDVFSDRPVLVFGKYRGAAKGRLVLGGTNGVGTTQIFIDVAKDGKSSPNNQALRYLWARHQVQELEDRSLLPGKTLKSEIAKLGLKYGLMTSHTSFVAVDPKVRNKDGSPRTIRQALPMPQGVPNSAVGGYGYGVSGHGIGGGGSGWGTIGIGSYGTIGSGSGSAYGSGRGRKAAPPTVRIGRATISGSLDRNIIRRYIRRKLSRIRHCYEKELLRDPSLSGTVVVSFQIGKDGAVVSSVGSGFGNSKVQRCVAQAVKTITFPKVRGGGTVSVRYPFRFLPSSN